MDWQEDPSIKKEIKDIVRRLELKHIQVDRLFCYRTSTAKSRAYARIWSFPKIFQNALNIEPAYVLEVLSQYYDDLPHDEKVEVLIHELLHIPKNFSGSLLPHKYGKTSITREARKLYKIYKSKRKSL